MQTCPACHKTIPARDRYCAYCGTKLPRALPWAGWVPGTTRVGAARRGLWPGSAGASSGGWLARNRLGTMAVVGGLLGAGVGGVLGQAFGNAVLGALVGAVGAGVAATVGEEAAGPLPDRRAAERFGLVLGGLGGALGLLVGPVVVGGVVLMAGGWAGLSAFWAQVRADWNLGLVGPLAGAIVATVAGAFVGYLLGQAGYRLGRRGAIAGAALAWMLAAVLAGLVTADQTAGTAAAGVARGQAAILGILLQVGGGAALLAAGRRWVGRLRGWWVGRP